MAPTKKTPVMVWLRKLQQSVAEKKRSLLPDCLSPCTSSAKTATREHTLSVPDWSLLPEELLNIISKKLEDCFDVIHARSVCTFWRSIFPFPSCLLRKSYSLPSLAEFPGKSKGSCSLERFQMFLFRVRAPPAAAAASTTEFFLGGLCRDESEDHMELSSPIQCSVKMKISGSAPTLMNMLDCQIIPLGYQYRMIGLNTDPMAARYRGVAFLPLNKEGGDDFVLLIAYADDLFVLRSDEMRWLRLEKATISNRVRIVTFRGRFYAVFRDRYVFVIDPYSLELTPLMPSDLFNYVSCYYLVPSGDGEELFLVEKIIPSPGFDYFRFILRVSRLDEDAGKWVDVNELGDRVLFIEHFGNVSCSAKELPDGCGVSGNSILFANEPGPPGCVTYAYKYGVHTGRAEDDLDCWRFSRENRLKIFSTSLVVTLRVERRLRHRLSFFYKIRNITFS